jgi:hypothetical protein
MYDITIHPRLCEACQTSSKNLCFENIDEWEDMDGQKSYVYFCQQRLSYWKRGKTVSVIEQMV